MTSRLRIGTRGSALARAQSEWTAARLRELHPGLEVDLIVIKTSGDRFSAAVNAGKSPEPAGSDAPNLKAMFVKEIESALLAGEVDLAVHSAKDMPAELPEGLGIAVTPSREDCRDAFLPGGSGASWRDLPPGSCVGTASLRRSIQLGAARPDLKFAPVRGNVDTRIKKLQAGDVDGLVLAMAGLKRLGLSHIPHEPIGVDVIVPAPGQGALAIEARSDREEVRRLLAPLEDRDTAFCLGLERRFLSEIGGGCSTPLGVVAQPEKDRVRVDVFWSDPDGSRPRRFSGAAGRRPEELDSLVNELCGRIGS